MLRSQEESESQFKNSKEGGYTSQGWTHIPLINSREPPELYEPQRAHFPKTLKVCSTYSWTLLMFAHVPQRRT